MSLWDAVKYGHSVVWALKVEGIETLFVERATRLSVAGIYTEPFAGITSEDASLVVDDSPAVGSEVDRYRGIGVGMSFSFKLLETHAVKQLMTRPSRIGFINQNVASTDMTLDLADASSFPTSGKAYLGLETVSYNAKIGNQLQVSQRGVAGRASEHRINSSGNQVSSGIRWWQGREVQLWAFSIDPSGQVPGTNFETPGNCEMMFRGTITSGPKREAGAFAFGADSLERALDCELYGGASGTIASIEPHFAPSLDFKFGGKFEAFNTGGSSAWSYDIIIEPFANLTPSEVYSSTFLRQTMSDAFDAALTAVGATSDILGMRFIPWPQPSSGAGFSIYIDLAYSATIFHVVLTNFDAQQMYWFDQSHAFFGAGMAPAPNKNVLHLQTSVGLDPSQPVGKKAGGLTGLAVELDNGIDFAVPSSGVLAISAGDVKGLVSYQKTANAGGFHYFSSLQPVSSGAMQLNQTNIQDATCEVLFQREGSAKVTALQTITSSGVAGLRSATYDTGQRGSGYGISETSIDLDGFASLDSVPLQLSMNTAGASFVDLFGGLLAISRRAVVAKQDQSDDYKSVKLSVVKTAIGQAHQNTITDDDLLAYKGQPVEMLDVAPSPNLIKVSRTAFSAFEEVEADTITLNDGPSIEALGATSQEWSIPAKSREELMLFAVPFASSYLAEDRSVLALSLTVPPWVKGDVGETVKLELTHPTIWSYTGETGYTGPGLIVSRKMDLKTLSVELMLLIQGVNRGVNLSPSMPVLAFAGTAASPTTISVDKKYYDHLLKSLEGNATVSLLHYFPGQAEGVAEVVTYDSVSLTASHAVISVATESASSLNFSGTSHLTVVHTGGPIVDYQRLFAHTDSPGFWS